MSTGKKFVGNEDGAPQSKASAPWQSDTIAADARPHYGSRSSSPLLTKAPSPEPPLRRVSQTASLVDLPTFIKRWTDSSASERANKDSFLNELCDVLEVPRPEPKTGDVARDLYVFERETVIPQEDGSAKGGRMDLYKHGCFVLEAKQGSRHGDPKGGIGRRETKPWKMEMRRAVGQATGYARTLSPPPPFLIVCDIGYCFDIYVCFDGSRNYRPFHIEKKNNRILIQELPQRRETLRKIFIEPASLDPSEEAARVTRDLAGRLAVLAGELEDAGHSKEDVARFLMRCLFTMFAEDVRLLPKAAFSERIKKSWIPNPASFVEDLEDLWQAMNEGRRYGTLGKLLHFNGGLFSCPKALPLSPTQLNLLSEAADRDWSEVEPAIFGTLLERAFDKNERQRLGAHYTPRAYVERLVRPTIEEPLRKEWDVVQAQVWQLHEACKDDAARAAVREFLHRLCRTRVLDPACGSGNFLYVALDLFKRIEAEALNLLRDLGDSQTQLKVQEVSVMPHQFLGIEVNRWAKEIAALVLWIGYLQSHFRMWGDERPPEPVLRKDDHIECRDAVLAWAGEREPVLDDRGNPVTVWNGVTKKKSPVTGEEIPDETARVTVYSYKNPRLAEWPEAEFVISNPPFVGNPWMRGTLGQGYVEALRAVHKDVPDSCDYVMYWWHHAAQLLQEGKIRRFGFITTNSITQTRNRQVLQAHLKDGKGGISLHFAIPDHPWVDSANGADVRIAMTVATSGVKEGALAEVVTETRGDGDSVDVELSMSSGLIHADLKVGANVIAAVPLRANDLLCSPGVKLHGAGFIVTRAQAKGLGLGRIAGLDEYIRPYRNGRDLTAKSRDAMVIDLHGLDVDEVRRRFPEVFQWVYERVKPERDHNNERYRRENWWLFGRKNTELRAALRGLPRYISTVETSKHCFFVFMDAAIRPDNKLINIGLDDAFFLGVLSSRAHVAWALAAGGHLGVGNDPVYVKTSCWDKFPFPECSELQKAKIRKLGDELDRHRKERQSSHPELTITGMYNVLDKICAKEDLTDKERLIKDDGLISTLLGIHKALDAAVLEAYGWPQRCSDQMILERLVTLNAERAAEERSGKVRWLRPEFQSPSIKSAQTSSKEMEQEDAAAAQESGLRPWPKRLPEQIALVFDLVSHSPSAWSVEQLARSFKAAKRAQVEAALQSLAVVGVVIPFKRGQEQRWRSLQRAA